MTERLRHDGTRRKRLTRQETQDRLDLVKKHGRTKAAKMLNITPQGLWMWLRDQRNQAKTRELLGGLTPRQVEKMVRGARLIIEAFEEP